MLEHPAPELGWYPDPTQRHAQRFFDGRRWTQHVADGDTLLLDPIEAVARAEADEPLLVAASDAPAPPGAVAPARTAAHRPPRDLGELVIKYTIAGLLVIFLVLSVLHG